MSFALWKIISQSDTLSLEVLCVLDAVSGQNLWFPLAGTSASGKIENKLSSCEFYYSSVPAWEWDSKKSLLHSTMVFLNCWKDRPKNKCSSVSKLTKTPKHWTESSKEKNTQRCVMLAPESKLEKAAQSFLTSEIEPQEDEVLSFLKKHIQKNLLFCFWKNLDCNYQGYLVNCSIVL